jgi:hypothetical protein
MKRLMSTLIIGLLVTGSSLAQESLVGAYRLVSMVRDVKGVGPTEYMGKAPRGSLIFTPKHVIFFWTAETRKPGTSVADKAALYDTLNGFSGRYRVDGNKLIISVDASVNETWTGTDQVRYIEWSGNRLTLTTDLGRSARNPSQTVLTRQVWEKVE